MLADGAYWHSQLENDRVDCHLLLIDPTKAEVLDGVVTAAEALESHRDMPGWSGGQIDFVFSGHGSEDGTLHLSDSLLSVEELAEIVAARREGQRRLVSVALTAAIQGSPLLSYWRTLNTEKPSPSWTASPPHYRMKSRGSLIHLAMEHSRSQ